MAALSVNSTENTEVLILTHLPQVELLARRPHRHWQRVDLDDLISTGTSGHRLLGPLPRNMRRLQKQRDALIAEFSSADEIPTNDQIVYVRHPITKLSSCAKT